MQIEEESISNIQDFLDNISCEGSDSNAIEELPFFINNGMKYHFQAVLNEETTAVADNLVSDSSPPLFEEEPKTDELSYIFVVEESNEGDHNLVLTAQECDKYFNEEDQDESNQDMKVYQCDDQGNLTSESSSQPHGFKIPEVHHCNMCTYTNANKNLLVRHMKCHTDEKKHTCHLCGNGFRTVAALQNHINTHTGNKPHRCKYCESCFTTAGELARHTRYRHTHEKPHRCTECSYASVELSKLKRHMRSHTGEKPFQCPNCTYASPDNFKLKRHMRTHTGEKPYACSMCPKRFTQSNSLKSHELTHTGQQPVFRCDHCPTTCGRKTDLRIHIQKLHTSEQPLKCGKCNRFFPDRYSLKVHVRTHEGEKCFRCALCSYASACHRHLESHMLVHTDQKPFQCEHCDQAFRQKQLLRRHINIYHDPDYVRPAPGQKSHQCPECDKAFRHKGNLVRHLALHDAQVDDQDGDQMLLTVKVEDMDENVEMKMEKMFDEGEDVGHIASDPDWTESFAV